MADQFARPATTPVRHDDRFSSDEALSAAETDLSALDAALLRSASTMVDDPAEARALVALALRAARERPPQQTPVGLAEICRLLRQAFHSIERSHGRRRIRDSAVTTLAVHQASSRAAQGG